MNMVDILAIALFLAIIVLVYLRYSSSSVYENFTSPPVACSFVKLGSYKLTTTPLTSTSTGQIYIPSLPTTTTTSIPSAADSLAAWSLIATPVQVQGVNGAAVPSPTLVGVSISCIDNSTTPNDVNTMVQNIQNCLQTNPAASCNSASTPNSLPAIILCLQNDSAVGTGTVSRVFFVQSSFKQCLNGAMTIIGNNTNTAFIQGAVGYPNTTDTYSLSYTVSTVANRPNGFSYTDCCSAIPAGNIPTTLPVNGSDPAVYCCRTDPSCVSPNFCSNNVCISPLGAVGATCSKGADCASGTCTNQVCVATPLSPLGATCSKGANCASGICTNQTCVSASACPAGDSNDVGNTGGSDPSGWSWGIMDDSAKTDPNSDGNQEECEDDDDDTSKPKAKDSSKKGSSLWDEFTWPQRFYSGKKSSSGSTGVLQPGLDTCNQFYTCTANSSSKCN